ncbi:MAG: hypothetical protein LBQ77_02700 [Treponema sp.]|jgi:hypothetical protein|nr:hypothetical protein [Treponema sp.]
MLKEKKNVLKTVGWIFVIVMLSACSDDYVDSGSLLGSWAQHDSYTITNDTVEYNDGGPYYDNSDPPVAYPSSSFTGTIKNNPDFSASSGVIIIKYTVPPAGEDVGNYTAIYWRNLTDRSVLLANAWDQTGTKTATLAEAEAKFTLSNAEIFVNWSIVQPQLKQSEFVATLPEERMAA